jgi:acyl carrier protein
MDILQEIKNYILTELAYDYPKESLTNEVDLLMSGIIDSMGVMQLSAFIEQKFGVGISPEEVVPENFRSLATLEQFIKTKMS